MDFLAGLIAIWQLLATYSYVALWIVAGFGALYFMFLLDMPSTISAWTSNAWRMRCRSCREI